MEESLSKLFDYQKFVRNPRLQAVIDSVCMDRRELSPEEAELVCAAGSPYYQSAKDELNTTHSQV